jgi:hypothetical protein
MGGERVSDGLAFVLIAAVAVGLLVIFRIGARRVQIAIISALVAFAVFGLVVAYLALSTWRP